MIGYTHKVNRFIRPQQEFFDIAKQELIDHKKESHWIWFLFPQLDGLGYSYLSHYYGLSGIKETRAFYRNRFLRENLISLINILLSYKEDNLVNVLGVIDTKKMHSSATIFYLSTRKKIFKNVLDKFYGGVLDEKTIQLLKNK